MALSTFLQALISIVFIYLILSLLTSELQEYLATIFEARAKRLKQSIRQMLGEQDYPYYRLEFNSSDKFEKDNWIWLQDGKINKIIGYTGTQQGTDIFIKESDNSIIQKTDGDPIEDDKDKGKFYLKGEAVSQLSVYEGADKNKYWVRNVNLIDAQAKLTSDQQFIWIKEGDNTVVDEVDVEPDSPPSDKGKIKSDSSPVTKYPVYSEVDNPASKVWIKPEDNIEQVDPSANPTNNFVFIKQDGSFVNETDVISDSPNQHTYWIKRESIIKLPVASVAKILQNPSAKQNESPIYLIYLGDDGKFTILDGNNINVKLATFSSKSESKPFNFNFLTDKLYDHPNIQALNQSSFGWRSLFSPIINGLMADKKAFIYGNWVWIVSFLLSIILLVLSVLLNLPLWGFIISILPLLVTIGLLVRFYLKNEDKYGKGRKSIGPSYIEEPKLFAKTLISVIKENSDPPTEPISTALSNLKFYTPAIPTLKKMLESSSDGEFENFLGEQYNNIQKRSSGSYKRNSKGLSFVVGLLIAILCNADTFNMITNLTKEGNTTASQLVAALDKQDPTFFEDCKPDDTPCENKKIEDLKSIFNSIDTFPLGWPDGLQQKIEELKVLNDTTTFFKQAENDCKVPDQTKLLDGSTTCFKNTEKLLAESPDNVNYLTPSLLTAIQNVRGKDGKIDDTKVVQIPNQYSVFLQTKQDEIGLKQQEIIALIKSNDSTSTQGIAQQIQNTVNNQGGWIKVALGWLITAIALSMGAPFWFDQLSRIMNVRNGRKPKDP